MRILKTIGALLLGLFSGMVVIALIQAISLFLYPTPPGLDLHHNPDHLREFMQTLPITAFLIVLAGWALGTFCGAWVSVRLTPFRPMWPAWVPGGFFLLAAVMIFARHPQHP